MSTATLESPPAADTWGLAAQDRASRQAQQFRLCSLAAFLRRPEALDCDDAALAERFDVPEREIERAWERHFARIDARARDEAQQQELVRLAWSPADVFRLKEDGPPRPRNVKDSELAGRIANRPRPDIDRLQTHAARLVARANRAHDLRHTCCRWSAEFRAVRRRHRRLDWSPAVAS